MSKKIISISDYKPEFNEDLIKGFKTTQSPMDIIKANFEKGLIDKDTFDKAQNLLIKAGEGSRGGKITGHTKSGKAIYEVGDRMTYLGHPAMITTVRENKYEGNHWYNIYYHQNDNAGYAGTGEIGHFHGGDERVLKPANESDIKNHSKHYKKFDEMYPHLSQGRHSKEALKKMKKD